MESKRQLQYAKMIQKELSEIFQRDSKHLFGKAFITVTRTEMSPDLSIAKSYLSFMLVENKFQMLDLIREKTKAIRQTLGSRIRNQARIIPELTFFLDDSSEYAMKMDAIITNLNIPKED